MERSGLVGRMLTGFVAVVTAAGTALVTATMAQAGASAGDRLGGLGSLIARIVIGLPAARTAHGSPLTA